jgi:hypothetical protein
VTDLAIEVLPAMDTKAQASETALVLDADLTQSEWEEIGHTLGRANRASAWWIGDWINYGEDAGYVSRGKYETAAAITSLGIETLRQYSYVSRRFESSRRLDDLSFGHHQSAAALPTVEQDEVLPRAVAESWSIAKLRAETRARPSRKISSQRRHEALIDAAAALVRIADLWEREMTDALTPPQARKQLTVLHKARERLDEVIEAVEYRADTLATFRR